MWDRLDARAQHEGITSTAAVREAINAWADRLAEQGEKSMRNTQDITVTKAADGDSGA